MVCFMQKKRDSRNNNSRMKKEARNNLSMFIIQSNHTERRVRVTPSTLCCYTLDSRSIYLYKSAANFC